MAFSRTRKPVQSAGSVEDNGRNGITKRSLVFIFISLMVSMFVASLDQTIVSTALPTIAGELGGVTLMLWVSSSFLATSTLMMALFGKLGDRLGRKYLFCGALIVFIAGSAVCGLAGSMAGLIAGRAIQGIGGGGLMILSQAIIADVVPPRERGKYMGAMGVVYAASAVLGPLLGGWFTDVLGWRWCFWINIPLALFALTVSFKMLPKPQPQLGRARFDFAGAALLSAATGLLVFVFSWGGRTYPWDSPVILGLVAALASASAAFIAIEWKAADPVLPLHLFKNRNFSLATMAGLIIMIAMIGTTTYLPTYFQIVDGLAATAAGYMTLPIMAGSTLTTAVAGYLAAKTGRYKWMPLASCGVSAVALYLLSTLVPGSTLVTIGLYLFMLGFGMGLGQQILVLVVQNEFDISIVGTATAAHNFFREIGATIGVSLVGSLFTGNLMHNIAAASASNGAFAALGIGIDSITPEFVHGLDAASAVLVRNAYNDALTPIFLMLVPLFALGFVTFLFLRETPLAATVEDSGHMAAPARQAKRSRSVLAR